VSGAQAEGATARDAAILADACVSVGCDAAGVMGNLFIDLYIVLGDEIAMVDLAAWTCQGGPTVCAGIRAASATQSLSEVRQPL
jgi:hypothetical protein